MKKMRTIIWLLALMLILSLTACNPGLNTDKVTPTPSQEASQEAGQSANDTAALDTSYDDLEMSPEKAFDAFMALHPDSKVTEIKLEKNYGNLEYKVEGYDLSRDYEVRINAQSGDVRSDNSETLDRDDRNDPFISKDDVAKISPLVAKAMNEVNAGAQFEKWSLENDDGYLDFEIEFTDAGRELEFTYDLSSGALKEKSN